MTDYKLYAGQHEPGEGKRCAMEWVAYLAGEQHTDRPMCVDPQVGTFMRYLNDKLGDERRQMLRPYLARTIGTADDGQFVERQITFNEMREALGPIAAPGGYYAAKALSLESDETIRYWLDRLLPTVPLQLPVVADADMVCGVA
jgi:hypothetical protein